MHTFLTTLGRIATVAVLCATISACSLPMGGGSFPLYDNQASISNYSVSPIWDD